MPGQQSESGVRNSFTLNLPTKHRSARNELEQHESEGRPRLVDLNDPKVPEMEQNRPVRDTLNEEEQPLRNSVMNNADLKTLYLDPKIFAPPTGYTSPEGLKLLADSSQIEKPIPDPRNLSPNKESQIDLNPSKDFGFPARFTTALTKTSGLTIRMTTRDQSTSTIVVN